MLNVEIESIVKNIGSNVDFLQPLFESLVNSLEAGAKNIVIDIQGSDVLDDSLEPSVIGFTIQDDGVGFNDSNINSFCTLWSKHKLDIGCKGSGRFTWLTVFKNITITSFLKEEGVKVVIPFSLEFSPSDIEKAECDNIDSTKTVIEFKYVTQKYYNASNPSKVIDKRTIANSQEIKEKILDYLFVKFWFLKKDGVDFNIIIKAPNGESSIGLNDIYDLDETDFSIYDEINSKEQIFSAKYKIKKDLLGNRKIVLCSGRRSSHFIQPSSVGLNDKLPNKDSILFFVTSDYLDQLDTDDRKGLSDYSSSKDTNLQYTIAYQTLLSKIGDTMRNIIFEAYPTISTNNESIKEELKKEKPYLAKYIESTRLTIGSKKSLEVETLKQFEKDKIETSQRFENALTDRHIDPDDFKKAVEDVSLISAAELCEYILYRSKILSALSSEFLKDKKEEYLHDVFMPKRKMSDGSDYYNTNLWILDDKFMSYLYAFSDISILGINKNVSDIEVKDEHNRRRPDMFVAFDRKDGDKNAVIVEFKSYSASLDEKNKAISEIQNNIGTIRATNKTIKTIWAYIITKLDKDFVESIENLGNYDPIDSTGETTSAYYFYNQKRNAHIYIVDIDEIVNDAEVRNEVFLNIING